MIWAACKCLAVGQHPVGSQGKLIDMGQQVVNGHAQIVISVVVIMQRPMVFPHWHGHGSLEIECCGGHGS
jgi:hypothetical protein